jgi:hypothetical protein
MPTTGIVTRVFEEAFAEGAPAGIVTRVFEEAFAEGAPAGIVTRVFEEVFAEGAPAGIVTRLFQEVFADPGLTPELLNDESFFQPQAIYNVTVSPSLLSDEVLLVPSWTQFGFAPLLSDEALFTPVIPRSIQQVIFT